MEGRNRWKERVKAKESHSWSNLHFTLARLTLDSVCFQQVRVFPLKDSPQQGALSRRFGVSFCKEFLCAGNANGGIYVWDLNSGEVIDCYRSGGRQNGTAVDCQFSHDCRYVAMFSTMEFTGWSCCLIAFVLYNYVRWSRLLGSFNIDFFAKMSCLFGTFHPKPPQKWHFPPLCAAFSSCVAVDVSSFRSLFTPQMIWQ